MKQYEYEITKHANEDFTHLVYFCNAAGECSIDQVPENQINMLTDMLNRRGAEGDCANSFWEGRHCYFLEKRNRTVKGLI